MFPVDVMATFALNVRRNYWRRGGNEVDDEEDDEAVDLKRIERIHFK